jgi:hypothetical protein
LGKNCNGMIFPRKLYHMDGGCITCAKMRPRGQREADPFTLQNGKWGLKFNGVTWRASRLSFCLNKAEINVNPAFDDFVLHDCDNDWCINPDHLHLGTIKQNAAEKFARHPTIHAIMRDATKLARKRMTEDAKASMLSGLYGQPGQPSYKRSEESRNKSAASRRSHRAALSPEEHSAHCKAIAEGCKKRKEEER